MNDRRAAATVGATADGDALVELPVDAGFRVRDPLRILLDPDALSGTERLVMMLATEHGSLSRSHGRGAQFRAALLRPINHLLRTAASAGHAASAAANAVQQQRPATSFSLRQVEAALEHRWGASFRQPREILRRLQHLPVAGLVPKRLSAVIDRSRAAENGAWMADQQWGLLVDTYLMDVAFLAAQFAAFGRLADSEALEAAQFALIDQESRRHVAELGAAGRPLLFCGLHAGAFGLGRRVLRHLFPDLLLLGAYGEATQGDTRVSAHDPVRAMMQMVRHLRRPGTTALIAGDGPVSGATRKVEVCGVPISVALGAPHIAFHAKCVTAFFVARWDGRRVHLDIRTELEPDHAEGLDAWTDRWMLAWAALMSDLVKGDARNIRGHSGFWAQLDRETGIAQSHAAG